MKTVPLGEVAAVNPRGEKVNPDQEISFVGMAELDALSAIAIPLETRPFKDVSKGYTVFRDGDVLAAKITPCWENGKVGQARLVHSIGVGSTEFHVIRPTHAANARYVLHLLRTPSVRAAGEMRMTGSGGQKRVPADFFKTLRVPLPDLEEQRRIATILDHADAIRTKRRQVLSHLETLTQSIFDDMFGGDDCDHEFGSIIKSGPTNGMYRPASDYGDGTPILRIDGFSHGDVLRSSATWKQLRANAAEIRRYSLERGDLVVNRVNALSHLGKTALIACTGVPSVYESNMMRVRVDASKTEPVFVLAWLQTKEARRQILRKAKKAINQASINQTDVKSLLMPLPPLDRQRQFVERAEHINTQRGAVQQALIADDELFASLQSRAFKGEL
ncbi:restriction endonuclease subunit S [Nocardioides sp. NBC_00368]|uniref:restriction endonuclease subunit S n=1 Tax=Nocardioides sp. NBC_00368 TaxID=2976000 RepID=UPI002E1F1F18